MSLAFELKDAETNKYVRVWYIKEYIIYQFYIYNKLTLWCFAINFNLNDGLSL
jgi:hypothetical protein